MKVVICFMVTLWPFLVFGQCKTIRKKTDKFDGKITISGNYAEPAVAIKTFEEGQTAYYLSLAAPASASADRDGVSLLFADGSKMDFPAEPVSIRTNGRLYKFGSVLNAAAFVTLTEEQVRKLSESVITDYKLHIFVNQLAKRKAEQLRAEFGCLLEATPQTVKE